MRRFAFVGALAALVGACTGGASVSTSTSEGAPTTTSSFPVQTTSTAVSTTSTSMADTTTSTVGANVPSWSGTVVVGTEVWNLQLFLGANDEPIVTYIDPTSAYDDPADGGGPPLNPYRLMMLRCSDPECSDVEGPTPVVDAAFDPFYSFVILPDGSPVVGTLVFDELPTAEDQPGSSAYRLTVCDNPDCSTSVGTDIPNRPDEFAVQHLGLLGDDLVLNVSPGDWSYQIWSCDGTDCGSPTLLMAYGDRRSGWPGYLVLGPGGRPAVANAWGAPPGGVHLVTCSADECNGTAVTKTWFEGSATTGNLPQPAITPDNRPLVAAIDGDRAFLIECTDPDCSSDQVVELGAASNDYWDKPAITVTPAGQTLVAWRNGSELMVATCQDASCTTTDFPLMDTQPGTDMAIGHDGLAYLAYSTTYDGEWEITILKCSNENCGHG